MSCQVDYMLGMSLGLFNTNVYALSAPKNANRISFSAKRLAEDSGPHDHLTSATSSALLPLVALAQGCHRNRTGIS